MSDFTIDGAEIDTTCPRCGFTNPVWLKQVRLRDVIVCRGCKANINLDDHMNEVRNAERATRQAVAELMNAFGNWTIRI